MSKSRSSSHGPWQGTAQWKHGCYGAWKGWDDSSATVAPAQNREQVSDETRHDGLAHDAGSLTADDSHDPAPLLLNCAQSTEYQKQRRCAAYEAMEALTAARAGKKDARRICDKMCGEVAIAEIICTTGHCGRPRKG